MSDAEKRTFTDEEALDFHRHPTPGKIAIAATKPMATQSDLSLAYSPGVAAPVLAIAKNPDDAYEYTSKGNLVAIFSNGTAILGLGNLGALASKPVMEGKAVLFKRFADVDAIDVECVATDPDEVITVVKNIGLTYGGINLEDIKSPECFRIETELQELLDIPVFHDDQHGTAIISAAGLINACEITGRDIKDVKVVLNGPGAAGIATLELIKAMGVAPQNVIAVDRKGVLYRGRAEDMNQWKSAHAVDTDKRTLAEALDGADVFIGLSGPGVVSLKDIKAMNREPIVFA
ncbi:MAG: malic enzyme-like NAD(P)-binding protein, partial [Phenylobacterium sp.]